MTASYIVSGCRTPQGKYLGRLSSVKSVELGGHAIHGVVERSGLAPDAIDQVIMGQVIPAGTGQAPARQAAFHGGLPATVGAVTVNKVCGSGLYSVMLADMAIRCGEYQRVIAGGMESMSHAPHLLRNGRNGWKYGEQTLLDAVEIDGLRCAYSGMAMGCIAEWVAKEATISRQQQDEWAVRSHQKAINAQDSGAFTAEITPVTVVESRKPVVLAGDEGPRRDCQIANLEKLSPVFLSALVASEKPATYEGTVTAGNSSTLADGAAAVLVVDKASRQDLRLDWAFRIVGHCSYANDHQKLFTAPVGAVRKLLHKTKMTVAEIDLWEINEAFAAQTLACVQELGLNTERVNVCGGAIALGHPLGCSGTRILVSLLHQLVSRGLTRGVATLCLGGGEAVAMMVERA